MNTLLRLAPLVLLALSQSPATPAPEDHVNHARGDFEVTITPRDYDGPAARPGDGAADGLARFALEKTFRGALEASGVGTMLTAGTEVEGSQAYVALERVTGTLDGRSGSFALQHRGLMVRGAPELSVTIVPDSGTGELKGLTGSLEIEIDAQGHHYDLAYTLPD